MWLLPITVIVLPIILAIPLSGFMARIMDGNYRTWPVFEWFEKRLDSGHQNWKQYTLALLIFNTLLYLFGYLVLSLQPWMPLNPRGLGMLSPSTIFNTVISFSTNTDIQHYSGDQSFSNFSQIFFCLPMFFLSAAIGLCALTAIIRAFRSDLAPRQLLRRYVAGGYLPVSSGRVRPEHLVSDPGHADDLSKRLPGQHPRARRNGH